MSGPTACPEYGACEYCREIALAEKGALSKNPATGTESKAVPYFEAIHRTCLKCPLAGTANKAEQQEGK